MTDILWWVQMADCTTFENWKEMRDIFVNFQLPQGAAAGYSWHGEMPEAISIIGSNLPMEVDDLFLEWWPHITGNEYMVFVEMKRTDVLSRDAITYYVMTANGVSCVKGIDAARYVLDAVSDFFETD